MRKNRRSRRAVLLALVFTVLLSFFAANQQNNIFNVDFLSLYASSLDDLNYNELSYEYDEAVQTLTISGDSAMQDFAEQSAPWQNYNEKAKCIEICDGVSYIGQNAFVSFSDLEAVTISDSVNKINNDAFVYCSSDFTVKGKKDSEAYRFAEKNALPFTVRRIDLPRRTLCRLRKLQRLFSLSRKSRSNQRILRQVKKLTILL